MFLLIVLQGTLQFTGDLPAAHGSCSTTTLLQCRQLTRLIVYNNTTAMFQIGGSRNSRCFKRSYTVRATTP